MFLNIKVKKKETICESLHGGRPLTNQESPQLACLMKINILLR